MYTENNFEVINTRANQEMNASIARQEYIQRLMRDENSFRRDIINELYTLEQETFLLEYLEAELLLEEESIKSLLSLIGSLYAFTKKPYQNIEIALKYINEAAELGNDDAIHNLGYIYQKGLGIPGNYIKAKEQYKLAAALGNLNAVFDLGVMYYEERDYPEAKKQFEKAALNSKNPEAKILLEQLIEGIEKALKARDTNTTNRLNASGDTTSKPVKPQRSEQSQALHTFLSECDNLQSDLSMLTIALQMIDHGADVNTENDKGDTLLHILFKNEEWLDLHDEESIKNHWVTETIQNVVLLYKADINQKNTNGCTPLDCFIDSGKFTQSFADSLIKLGANSDRYHPSDKTIKQFEDALAHRNGQAALDMFCHIYRINDTSNKKAPLLQRICALVEKNKQIHPVNHLYILKLLEHEEKIISIETEILKIPDEDTLSSYLGKILKESINDYFRPFMFNGPQIAQGMCARIKQNEKISHLFVLKLLEHEEAIFEATKCFYYLKDVYRSGKENSFKPYEDYYTRYLKQCVTSYFKERFSVNYVNLWTISHAIQNWESVKGVFNSLPCCNPDSYFAVQYAIKFPILNSLLKDLDIKAKSEGQLPLMHAIIKSVNQSIKDQNFTINIIKTLSVLSDIFKKVAACERRYLTERDIDDKDVIYHLDDLKDAIVSFCEANGEKIDESTKKIKEMIEIVTKAIQNEKIFSSATHLLFHYESTFFDLPKNVKKEIGMALDMKL